MQKTEVGFSIEALVCTFLELNGLRCVEKNYACRLGEIDLVMHDQSNDALVFVEVRFRTRVEFGSASESVDRTKQRKLKRAVLHYLQKHADAKQSARIDVIGVNRAVVANYLRTPPLDTPLALGVSTHQHEGYLLQWTRNAVED